MNVKRVANPPARLPAGQDPATDSVSTVMASWMRAFFFQPNRVVTVFWAAGTVAVLSVLPIEHWPRLSFIALVVIAVISAVVCTVRVIAGRRVPHWVLHVDVGVATVVVSVLAAIGGAHHVDFADLYVWVALFSALYFRPPAVIAHVAAAGAAYALTLGIGPSVVNPWGSWIGIVGTMALPAATVLGLVSVLRVAAREDSLTGLANRRMWDERLEEELERSRRTEIALSVAMIDLDGFKAVNNRLGHEGGNRLLQEIAHAWQVEVRGGGDFLARLGGDEFGLLAPGSDETGIRRLAKRLAEVMPDGAAASIGVATWNRTESASDLLRRADRTMYQAKRRRRRGQERHPA
ncbi:MAG: GGDEF domain-containing protein [Acidimicrobiales bacterium]